MMENFEADQLEQMAGVDSADSAVQVAEHLAVDEDGDGYADRIVHLLTDGAAVVVLDEDGDNLADAVLVDLDGDGIAEMQVLAQGDGFLVSIDENGSGGFDLGESVTMTSAELAAANPDLLTLLESRLGVAGDAESDGAAAGGDDAPVDEFGIPLDVLRDGAGMIGDPDAWSEHWFGEAANGNSVPASVAQIIAEYSGVEFVDETAFVELAQEAGLFHGGETENGMTPENAEKLLNLSGVPATLEYGNVGALAESLADGRGVMVGISTGEGEPDRCVVVSGIDAERGLVYLSDPSVPDGGQVQITIEQFEDAWADSGNAMVVCDQPAPEDGAADMSAVTAVNPKMAEILGDAATSQEVREGTAAAVGATVGWLTDRPWAILPVMLPAPELWA